MKALLALLALLCALPLRAEDPLDFFPHHVGDKWIYSTGTAKSYRTITNVEVDDHENILLSYNGSTGASYFIDKAYNVYFPLHDINRLEYKLDAKKGDRWIVRREDKEHKERRNEAEVTKEYQTVVLGHLTTVKEIAYFDYAPGDSAIEYAIYMYTQFLAAGIGLYMEIGEAGGVEYELTGCIINGETLGVVTSVYERVQTESPLLSNWPNPCHNQTILHFFASAHTIIEITDILGNTVFSILQENIQNGENNYIVNTSGWKPGIYFCRLTDGRQTVMRKIIVY